MERKSHSFPPLSLLYLRFSRERRPTVLRPCVGVKTRIISNASTDSKKRNTDSRLLRKRNEEKASEPHLTLTRTRRRTTFTPRPLPPEKSDKRNRQRMNKKWNGYMYILINWVLLYEYQQKWGDWSLFRYIWLSSSVVGIIQYTTPHHTTPHHTTPHHTTPHHKYLALTQKVCTPNENNAEN